VATIKGSGRAVIMRVLVTGSNGQLGSALIERLTARGTEVFGYDLPDIDIINAESVRAVFDVTRPDVVINCAAWTAVDAAEDQESAALLVNGVGPGVLALACDAVGAWLVQVSTDYVFAGDASAPYAEDDEPDPRTAYGRTKLVGEEEVRVRLPGAHYIVRTAWLYGLVGQNFVKTMLRLADERETVDVVDDQWGQPTFAGDLADQIIALIDARPPAGTFHATNAGAVTWFGFAEEIFRLAGIDPARVRAVTSAEFIRPAPRPAYSVLGHDRWTAVGMMPMRDWRPALADAMAQGIGQDIVSN
jgi:dTDP-4-dehydrorhamnose reductase